MSAYKFVIGIIVICVLSWYPTRSGQLGRNLVKIQQQKPMSQEFYSWKVNSCLKVRTLLRKKAIAVKKLDMLVSKIESTKMTFHERQFQVRTFRVFQQELNEAEQLIFQSLSWLSDSLKGNYKDILNMKESSKTRLGALRDATLKEEQEYNEILKAERLQEAQKERLKHQNHSSIEGLLDDILVDVANSADKLERDLDDHVFDHAFKDSSLNNGANIEAVIRLENNKPDDNTASNHTAARKDTKDLGIIKLVDAHDNQFVLSKGKDSTVPHEDHHFIMDVVLVMMLSFFTGWVCNALHLPTMFGFIIAGLVLGPSGFNILRSLVQLETLGEFGVFFILFCVGLEFSPEKLKRVLKVATVGSISMMMLMIVAGILVGMALNAAPNESGFVAACLSLSSTPLIVKFLAAQAEKEDEQRAGSGEYGTVLLGILVMQDVVLGLLIALLPNLAQSSINLYGEKELVFMYVVVAMKLSGAILLILVVCWITYRYLVGPMYRYLLSKGNKEMTLLATITLAFIMLLATDFLHISMELGCFLAGVMVSAQGPKLVEQLEPLVQPIKDLLGCLFFASIGLHVFPTFLGYELTILTTLTIAVVVTKFLFGVIVLAVLLPTSTTHVKWIVAAGLAQVSEFSFVLGSRARRLGIISREVYLLILSITTMSLLLAPVLWRVSLWHLRVKHHTRLEVEKRPVTHSRNCSRYREGDRVTRSDEHIAMGVKNSDEDDEFEILVSKHRRGSF